MNSSTRNAILVALAVLVVIGGAYYLWQEQQRPGIEIRVDGNGVRVEGNG